MKSKIFTYLLLATTIAKVTGSGLFNWGNGASVLQKSLNGLYELPQRLLPNLGYQPETLMNVTQIIRYHGYTAEEHSVVTEDGYILNLQRIPPEKTDATDSKLPPILLMHGYFGYAGNFVSNTPDNAPAFLLAKAGFDVWMVNQRGTEYSRGHKSLNPNSAAYWKFSWDEVAYYDLPACIGRMLNVTGHQQIFYVGHSLGGALPFALLATRPEYMSKIKAIYALAPMVYLVNISKSIKDFAPAAPILQKVANHLGVYMYPKYSPKLMGFFGKYLDSFIKKMIFRTFGTDDEQWNSSRTEVNLAHLFSSTCLNVYYHESELVVKPGFRMFDWGERINKEKYGQPHPPDYNITGITVPTHIYYGDNDILAPINNAQFLTEKLKNSEMHVAGRHWNNLDFLWAKDAAKEFYNGFIISLKSNKN